MASKKFKLISAYLKGGAGDVFVDRLYPEWPNLYGYEVSEEKPAEKPKAKK